MKLTRWYDYCRYLNFSLLWQILQEIGRQGLVGLAAQMAYNNLLALFPTIIAVLTAIGALNIEQHKVDYLSQQLLLFAPEQVLNLIRGFIRQVRIPQGEQVFSISFAIALWLASGAVGTAMVAMDRIYQIPEREQRPFWQAKLISILLTLGTISLLFIASFLIFISDWLLRFILAKANIFSLEILSLWNYIRWTAALIILAATFATIYRYGVSRWQARTPLIPGAVFSALLWALISRLFRLYVSNFGNYNLTYGTLGTG